MHITGDCIGAFLRWFHRTCAPVCDSLPLAPSSPRPRLFFFPYVYSLTGPQITDDYNKTLSMLDSVRARRTKFVCVNDDMHDAPIAVRQLLRDFYDSFFHDPSPMELPPGVANPYLYIEPLRAHYRARAIMFWSSLAGVLLFTVTVIAGVASCFLESDGSFRSSRRRQKQQLPPGQAEKDENRKE